MFSILGKSKHEQEEDPRQGVIDKLDSVITMESAVFKLPERYQPGDRKDRIEILISEYKNLKYATSFQISERKDILESLRSDLNDSNTLCDASFVQDLEIHLSALLHALASLVTCYPSLNGVDEDSWFSTALTEALQIVGDHTALAVLVSELLKRQPAKPSEDGNRTELDRDELYKEGTYLHEIRRIFNALSDAISA